MADLTSQHIYVGEGAPNFIPPQIAAHYTDQLNKKLYFSVGKTAISDWQGPFTSKTEMDSYKAFVAGELSKKRDLTDLYLPYYDVAMAESNGEIDMNAARVFRIDCSTARIVTIANPPVDNSISKFALVYLYNLTVEPTFDESIVWELGGKPDLSTNNDWAMVGLMWVGQWVASMKSASNVIPTVA